MRRGGWVCTAVASLAYGSDGGVDGRFDSVDVHQDTSGLPDCSQWGGEGEPRGTLQRSLRLLYGAPGRIDSCSHAGSVVTVGHTLHW